MAKSQIPNPNEIPKPKTQTKSPLRPPGGERGGSSLGIWVLGFHWVLGFGAFLHAQEAPVVDYGRDVKPLLRERCYACHGALKQKGKLRTDTVAAMTKAGAIFPGDPGRSSIV